MRHPRKEQGFSQEELAFRAGLHWTYMGGIERGGNNATLVTADEPARASIQKRVFAEGAERVLEEVVGTPPGRTRLAFQHLPPEDSLGPLAESGSTAGRYQEG